MKKKSIEFGAYARSEAVEDILYFHFSKLALFLFSLQAAHNPEKYYLNDFSHALSTYKDSTAKEMEIYEIQEE